MKHWSARASGPPRPIFDPGERRRFRPAMDSTREREEKFPRFSRALVRRHARLTSLRRETISFKSFF